MPAQVAQTARVIDEQKNLMENTCAGFELKSHQGEDYIEGYLATKGVDKGRDLFTDDALREMAEDLKSDIDSIDVYFPSFSEEDLRNAAENSANNGNIDHNNSPAGVFGDPRIVPAFKLVEAEYDGFGVKVRAVLNTDGLLPKQADAVKNSVREGYLNAMSVEYVALDTDTVERNGEEVRLIKSSTAKGAALTGRPMQSRARLTDTDIKSMMEKIDEKVEYKFEEGDTVSWDTSGGPTDGVVRDRTKDSCFNERIDGDVEVCGSDDDPAYLIEVGAEEDDGTMVAHLQSELRSGSAKVRGKHMKNIREDAEETEDKSHWKEEAGVRFQGTKTGELDEGAIDKEETDLSDHYLFGEGEDKEDFSYPVVDAEGFLRRGNVDAAHQLGARGGVDASELDRKLKALNDEFDNPPIDFKEGEKHTSGESMTEESDEQTGEDPEQKSGDESLEESVQELKSTVQEVKSQNEELREKNEELESEIEDYQETMDLKSDVEDLEEELKSLADEMRPVSDPEEKRNEQSDDETPAELKAASSEFLQKNSKTLAEKHSMTEEEVLEHA